MNNSTDHWDQIYQDHLRGGPAWATLSEGVDPRFISLVEKEKFSVRRALDIGCGTGKYLEFLQDHDFEVYGIDSSHTAIEMTRKVLRGLLPSQLAKNIQPANMFTHTYQRNFFDLILSVSTIHHGSKPEVVKLIDRLYTSLVPGGWIFLTLPNHPERLEEQLEETHEKLEEGVYAPYDGPEKGLAHSFFSRVEVERLFPNYSKLTIDLDEIGRWFLIGQK